MVKRRTREQKKIADLRRKISQLNPTEITKTTAAYEKPKISTSYTLSYQYQTPNKHIPTGREYAYVYQDLYKTTVVMLIMSILQLLLFTLLKMHIIHLPFTTY